MSELKRLNECVGKRVLIDKPRWSLSSGLLEALVVELSPSGKRVRLQFAPFNQVWVEEDEYQVVEVLA